MPEDENVDFYLISPSGGIEGYIFMPDNSPAEDFEYSYCLEILMTMGILMNGIGMVIMITNDGYYVLYLPAGEYEIQFWI